jgi:nucleoside-diphosphate-sugar epimerase
VDVTRPFQFPVDLPRIDTVLFAIGFDRSSNQSVEDVYVGGLRNVLQALPATIQRFIYVSSTGVYGQSRGEMVDEDSPCEPTRPAGHACLAAERWLADHVVFASRRIVLRLAGIYGPGRLPKLASLRAGAVLDAPATSFLNLIHVEDAVEVVLAADLQAPLPGLYIVSDGQPVLRGEFYGELARLLAAPTPRFIDQPLPLSPNPRAPADKRLDNGRMLAQLHIRLKFPSYREGLAAIVAGF